MQEMITITAAARLLDCSVETLGRHPRPALPEHRTKTNRRRYDKADVLALVKTMKKFRKLKDEIYGCDN